MLLLQSGHTHSALGTSELLVPLCGERRNILHNMHGYCCRWSEVPVSTASVGNGRALHWLYEGIHLLRHIGARAPFLQSDDQHSRRRRTFDSATLLLLALRNILAVECGGAAISASSTGLHARSHRRTRPPSRNLQKHPDTHHARMYTRAMYTWCFAPARVLVSLLLRRFKSSK